MRMTRGRLARLIGAAAVACASLPVTGVGTAHADSAALAPSNSAYFFSMGIDKPDASPAEPPNLTATTADGVSAGHLAVAAQGGTEDKVSFLYFDLFNLPLGSTVEKAVVTMVLVPNAPPTDISFNNTPELVQACKAGDGGFANDDGDGLALAPTRLCDAFSAKGKAGAKAGTYQWDVTGLAQEWITGENDGVAFTRADSAPGSNFQVVFDLASTATLDVTYAAPVVIDPVVEPPAFAPGPVLPPDPSGGFAPGSGVDLGTVDQGGTVPDPTTNPAPQPAASPAPLAAAPVAISASLRPDIGLWLGGLALLLALVVVSLVLGDVGSTRAARRPSRLSLALADRQRLAPLQTIRHRPA